MACARAPDAMAALGPREGIEARLRHAFGLPLGDIEAADRRSNAATTCSTSRLVRGIADANRAWGTATGLHGCDAIAAWLARDEAGRAATLAELASVVLTKAGDPRQAVDRPAASAAPDYEALAGRLIDCCGRLLPMRALAGMVAGARRRAARRPELRLGLWRRQARGGRRSISTI